MKFALARGLIYTSSLTVTKTSLSPPQSPWPSCVCSCCSSCLKCCSWFYHSHRNIYVTLSVKLVANFYSVDEEYQGTLLNWIWLSSIMEKAMAPHSSTLAWKIPWMEEPSGLQSMGSQRVGHNWTTSLSRIGEGNGNPLQCSCLENPRDRGAWWAAVSGVAQSRTWLKRLSSSSSIQYYQEYVCLLISFKWMTFNHFSQHF